MDLGDESKKRDRSKRLAHCQFCDKNLCDTTELYRHANHFHRVTSSTERFTDLDKLNYPDRGLVLDSSQFSILPQLLPKILLDSKVVTIDPKIISLLF